MAAAHGKLNVRAAAASLSPLIESVAGRWELIVRWLGSLTFALYLCHRPLLQFFSALRVGVPGTPLQSLWLLGMTTLVVIAVARVGEWLRQAMRIELSRRNRLQIFVPT